MCLSLVLLIISIYPNPTALSTPSLDGMNWMPFYDDVKFGKDSLILIFYNNGVKDDHPSPPSSPLMGEGWVRVK